MQNDSQTAAAHKPVPVMQILPHMEAGGVTTGTLEIAAAQHAAGFAPMVVSAGGSRVGEIARAKGEHVGMPVHRKTPWAIRANAKTLERLIRERDIKLVHARSRAPAWAALIAARRCGIPFVTTFHGTYGHRNFLKRRYNRVMTLGDRVIAISHHIADHIRSVYGIDEARLRVIHRGFDPRIYDPDSVSAERLIRYATQLRLPDGVPVVLMPGRLSRWKGQSIVIDAVSRLNDIALQCLIIGDDQGRASYRRALEQQIKDRGVFHKVRIMEPVRDMSAIYKLADVVVSASTDPEAFGRVMVEAQAMGRPVVASDHGGAPEIVRDGVTGWLVKPGDPEALAAGLRRALALGPGAREDLAAAAIRHARSRFTIDRMCDQTMALYRELLDDDPGRGSARA